MQITFSAHGTTYTLSTDHSQSNHGVPVLVTAKGDQLGPWDLVRYPNFSVCTARHIAALLDVITPEGSDMPYTSNPEIAVMLRRFEAVPRSGSEVLVQL